MCALLRDVRKLYQTFTVGISLQQWVAVNLITYSGMYLFLFLFFCFPILLSAYIYSCCWGPLALTNRLNLPNFLLKIEFVWSNSAICPPINCNHYIPYPILYVSVQGVLPAKGYMRFGLLTEKNHSSHPTADEPLSHQVKSRFNWRGEKLRGKHPYSMTSSINLGVGSFRYNCFSTVVFGRCQFSLAPSSDSSRFLNVDIRRRSSSIPPGWDPLQPTEVGDKYPISMTSCIDFRMVSFRYNCFSVVVFGRSGLNFIPRSHTVS